MALASGTQLVGIERSEEQLARAVRHPLLDLRQGDVLDPPLREREWGSFDLAHARYVFGARPGSAGRRPPQVRAVRPEAAWCCRTTTTTSSLLARAGRIRRALARVPAQLRSARLRSVHRPAAGLAAARSRRSACTLTWIYFGAVRR